MAQPSSTQRQRTLFRRFLIASVALHLLLASAFFLPDYLRKLRTMRSVTDARELERHRYDLHKLELAKAAAAATQQAAAAAALDAKQQVAAELHDEFRGVVGDQLKGADADQMWADILAQMTAGLDAYSREAADANADDGDLQEKMTDLQAKMLAELAAQLREKTRRELVDAFVARVRSDVSPKVMEYYRHQLETKIGNALRDEGVKIVRDDAAEIRDKQKAVGQALAEASRESSSALSDLAAAKKKVEGIASIADALRREGKNDKADEKMADAVRDAHDAVERAGKAVEAAGQHLHEAAEKASALPLDTQRAIRVAQDDVDRTVKDTTSAALDAQGGKTVDFSKSQGKAIDSTTQLGEAIKLARENLSHDSAAPSNEAQLALKHARDEDLKQLIEKAFWEKYANRSAPRLGGKLTDVFKRTMEDGGIKDDAAVAEVAKRVQAALVDEVRDKIRAGEAGTDPLSKTLKLNELADDADGPHGHDGGHHNHENPDHGHGDGNSDASGLAGSSSTQPHDAGHHPDARESAIADRIGKTARDLVHSNIDGIGDDDGGDEAAIKSVRDAVTIKHHGKGDGDADADADGLEGLAERVGRLADNVKGGRTDLAEAAHAAGLGGGGAVGAGAAGNGGNSRPHLPGIPERYHGPQLRHHSHVTDEAAYAKLTAGIHERDRLAAQGQATTRQSADGPVAAISGQDDARDLVRPAAVLVPAESKTEPIGQPQNSQPFTPKFKSIRFAAIPYRSKPVTIDGDLSEWKEVPELPMTPSREVGNLGPNLKVFPQAVKVQWDNTGFYLAYDVKDADDKITKAKPGDFWEGDGIEFWVDTLNTKEKFRTQCSHQFWAWVSGAVDNPAQVGGEARSWPGKDEYLPLGADVIKTASKKTDAGWTIEVFVPATKFRMLDLQPGRILGMNFSICTGTDLYYYWAGTTKVATARRPDTWGDVLLAGSAGRLECLDKLTADLTPGESARALNAVHIGQPLRVRVTDADMNLSDAVRDRVAVTVATHRGVRQTMVLEETANATGIFEGALPTALDTGSAPDGILPLLDGDQIDIVYIDQCRPDGSRDVPVKLTLPTASAVTRLTEK